MSNAEPLAAKVLKGDPSTLAKSEGIARFKREFANLKRICHPGVVRAVDFIHPKGQAPIIIMERVEGTPLGARQGQATPWRQAVWLVADILDALYAVHTVDLVHRDVTPGNIMLVESEEGRLRARIIDFGISFDEGAPLLTKTGQLLGTPHFIAPERTYPTGRFDHRADIYSVGALLFNILTGKLPFPDLQLPDELAVPAQLGDIIRIAIHQTPAQRYADASLMWRAVIASLAAPVESTEDAARRTRKLPLARQRNTPGYRAGRIEPGAGQRYRRLLGDVERSLKKYAWPDWATAEQRQEATDATLNGRLPLRTRRLGQPIEADWTCLGCGAIRQIPVLALGRMEHCEYCRGRQPTAQFAPLRESVRSLPGGLFDIRSGEARWQPGTFMVELHADDGSRLDISGMGTTTAFTPSRLVDGLKVVLFNKADVPLFKPIVRVGIHGRYLDIDPGDDPWVKAAESLAIPLGDALPLDVSVGLGGPEGVAELSAIRLQSYPEAEHIAVAIGDASGGVSDRLDVRPGDPISLKFVSTTPLPDGPIEATLVLDEAEESTQIPLSLSPPRGTTCRWTGELPPTLPDLDGTRPRFELRFGPCLAPMVIEIELRRAPDNQILAPTAQIGPSADTAAFESTSEPSTTGVTRSALRISGLRIPAETVLVDGGSNWTVPTVVAGLRCRHTLDVSNLGEEAVVLGAGKVVTPGTRAAVDWVEVDPGAGGWPVVLGQAQATSISLCFTSPDDEIRTEPLMLQLEFDIEGADRPDVVLLSVARINERRPHPAPLILEIGTSAVRYYTMHRGRHRPLVSPQSGSLLEDSAEIPAVCQILRARRTNGAFVPEGRAGRLVLEDMLTEDTGVHPNVRSSFDRSTDGIGGPLDTRPIFLETDDDVHPYIVRGFDLLDILIRTSWASICERYRLVVQSVVVVHPVGYSHLHLASIFRLLRRIAPHVDIHLGPSDATAWALSRPSREAAPLVVDVGPRSTVISSFERDGERLRLNEVSTTDSGGEAIGTALIRQVFDIEPDTGPPEMLPSTWGGMSHPVGSLFVEPGRNQQPARFHGPLPPWLTRLEGQLGGPERVLRPVIDEHGGSTRTIAALNLLRAACHRAALEPAWAGAAETCAAVARILPLIDWVDRDGSPIEPRPAELSRLADRLRDVRLLTGRVLDELVAGVRARCVDAEADVPILLTGRGHRGSNLSQRLAAETGRRVECGQPNDIARGAARWCVDPSEVDDAPVDRLRFAVCTSEGETLIPAGTAVRAAVTYCPVRGDSIHLQCRLDDDVVVESSAALDIRSIARGSKMRPVGAAFTYPAIALKVWVQPNHEAGRSELHMQTVKLAGWTQERLMETLARQQATAARMPRAADRLEGNAELETWLSQAKATCLDGEVGLGEPQRLAVCPTVTDRIRVVDPQ